MNDIVIAWVPGWMEITAVLALATLLFGTKLPGVGRFLGRNFRDAKKGVNDLSTELKNINVEVMDDPKKKKPKPKSNGDKPASP